MNRKLFVLLASLGSSVALAQNGASPSAPVVPASTEAATPVANVTTVTAPTAPSKAVVKYDMVAWGPAVSSPREGERNWSLIPNKDSGALKDPQGKPAEGAIFTENLITLGYRATDTVTVSAVPYFFLRARDDGKFEMQDWYLRAMNSNVYTAGKYSLAADVRVGLPTSKGSHNAGQLGYVRLDQFQNYEMGRFTLGLTTYLRGKAYQARANDDQMGRQNFKVYAGPEVDYTVTPNLKAVLLYEMMADSKAGQGAFAWNNAGTDFEPGLNWDITPQVNLSPFLDIKTGNRMSLDTTTINAALTVKML